jgi:homodimeric pyruvate:ferredoxin (flavodoxin) oxidoreductase
MMLSRKVGKAARKGASKSQGLRGLCTSRRLLKPARAEEVTGVGDLDDQIRAAAEQLANLRKARSNIQTQDRLKTTEDEKVAKFLQSQMAQQSSAGAEGGKLVGLSSITSVSDLDDPSTVVKQNIRAWDGCTACTHVAYSMCDDAFIFPITPSSPMAEIAEAWSVAGIKNVFSSRLNVQQLQSEAGAAGSMHGSVAAGGIGTTFTSSQGLLLMIPNMYKIAGELLPCVMHVAARALAGEALSIFGDHQDVMAARATGWGMLSSQHVQDCQDMALVAHLATLKARVPIVHFQDGFRTSHEINTIESLSTEHMRDLIDQDALRAQRARGLSPLNPVVRGSNQNPDVYMQALESANTYYDALPGIVEEVMGQVSAVTGRPLSLIRYQGHEEPEHLVVQMGSAVKVSESVISQLESQGEKVGVLSPVLFRPWPAAKLLEHLPTSVKTITVLDRTKEHGSFREPLFLDVAATLQSDPRFAGVTILGGRYGLGSKEYTPGMALSVFENAMGPRKDRFTVGINDDVTFTSLPLAAPKLDLAVPKSMTQCLFYGLAGDGTVGANKNAVKIIGDNSSLKAQAYFSYSSVKAGTPTVSHMRFGPEGCEAPYLTLPDSASYVACSFPGHINSLDMLKYVKPETGTFVLNCPYSDAESLEANLPTHVKKQIAAKNVQFYTIDASRVAQDSGLGKLTNNVMQTAFFNLSNVLPVDQAMGYFQAAIQKTYKKHGDVVIERNLNAVDNAMASLKKIDYPAEAWLALPDAPLPEAAKYEGHESKFVQVVQSKMVMLEGDDLPVSAFPHGGTSPMGLSNNEKKTQAAEVPEVDMDKCTQCNYCSYVCPHAVIRPFLMDQNTYDSAPASLEARKATSGEQAGYFYRIQVSAGDCTGCEVCVKTCPDDALHMVTQEEAVELNFEEHWNFLRALPVQEDLMKVTSVKGSQMQQPLLEYSAACAGCGETPYVKLLTQMFGDRMVIANATGCSSIWGNPYGSTPYTKRDSDGKGPAWHNSLFEDNAEFGFGMGQNMLARRARLHESVGELLKTDEIDVVPELRAKLVHFHEKWQSASTSTRLQDSLPALLEQAKQQGASSFIFHQVYDAQDSFLKTSQWIIGGDGWAYDIGFGGLDHVVASGANVNIMVLDTEAYSNTGGQKSKSTPAGSIAKFAMGGKERQKKNLGEICMSYGNVYVASCALGANLTQTVKAIAEAEEYNGPALMLCYSPCIEFKIAHQDGLGEMISCQQLAVSSGYWPLYRFDPRKELPMSLDQKTLREDLSTYLNTENRFNALKRSNPESFRKLTDTMRTNIRRRHTKYLAMMESAEESQGPPLTILYGSETGNTAELAARFAGMCKSRGYSVELAELNDVSVEDLGDKKDVVLMIATCGEGQIPQNAITLYEELGRAAPGCLEGMNYSIFALGDKAYRHFCSAGHDYDKKLSELGAVRVLDVGIGDDKDEDKFESGFEQWLPTWVETVGAPADPRENDPPAEMFNLTPVESRDALSSLARPARTQRLPLKFNKRISPADYDYSIRHITVDDSDHQLPYLLGDALAVNWTNDEARVLEFLSNYGLNADDCFSATPLPGVEAGVKADRLDGPFSVKSLFTDMLDIFGRPSKNFLKNLAKVAEPGADQERLNFLASEAGKEAFAEEFFGEALNFAEVLLKFPSVKPSLNQLITMLPVMKPRLYTIASSTRRTPGSIELTVITDDWTTPSGQNKCGSCTDFFERLDTDKSDGQLWIDCSISPGSFEFGAPEVPMVMTGTGTGVAPFLAFAKEREWFVNKFGPERAGEMWLFFGCRNKAKDYILGDDLEALSETGVLTHLRPAFSRDTAKKVYIQDRIKEEAVGVHNALVNKEGYLYMCGQAGDREKDVLDAVTKAFELAGMSPEAAKQEMDKLIEDGRYCPELY